MHGFPGTKIMVAVFPEEIKRESLLSTDHVELQEKWSKIAKKGIFFELKSLFSLKNLDPT